MTTWEFRSDIKLSSTTLCITWIVAGALFALLLLRVKNGGPMAIEQSILFWLHGYASPILDRFVAAILNLVTVISVAILICLMYQRWWRQALFWFTSAAGASVLASILKRTVQRPRPALWDLSAPLHSFGFPSGHATASLAIVITLLVLTPPRRRLHVIGIGLPFILLIALCRLYQGLHYPSDILAGWALSTGWICAVTIAFQALKIVCFGNPSENKQPSRVSRHRTP